MPNLTSAMSFAGNEVNTPTKDGDSDLLVR